MGLRRPLLLGRLLPLAGVVGALLLGVVVAVVGTFRHPSVWTLDAHRWPVGVAAGLAMLVLAELVARDAVPLRLGPAMVLLGWTVTVAVLGSSRPEGDLAIPATGAGEAFLYGGFVLGIVLAGWLALAGASGRARVDR